MRRGRGTGVLCYGAVSSAGGGGGQENYSSPGEACSFWAVSPGGILSISTPSRLMLTPPRQLRIPNPPPVVLTEALRPIAWRIDLAVCTESGDAALWEESTEGGAGEGVAPVSGTPQIDGVAWTGPVLR